MHAVPALPKGAKAFTPDWSERILEWSLLRAPAVLARAVGEKDQTGLVALKQISQIDLYLSAPQALHLIEIKKPTQHKLRHWREAASEVVRQWDHNQVWLRPGQHPVYLWVLCPVELSDGRQTPSSDALAKVDQESRKQLTGRNSASFGTLRYAAWKSRGCYFAIWREGEVPPASSQRDRRDIDSAQDTDAR